MDSVCCIHGTGSHHNTDGSRTKDNAPCGFAEGTVTSGADTGCFQYGIYHEDVPALMGILLCVHDGKFYWMNDCKDLP